MRFLRRRAHHPGEISNLVFPLLVGADPFFLQRSDQLIALAARHRVRDVHISGEFVAARGLMSYGTSCETSFPRWQRQSHGEAFGSSA
jgi:hypothetical protein